MAALPQACAAHTRGQRDPTKKWNDLGTEQRPAASRRRLRCPCRLRGIGRGAAAQSIGPRRATLVITAVCGAYNPVEENTKGKPSQSRPCVGRGAAAEGDVAAVLQRCAPLRAWEAVQAGLDIHVKRETADV